ncbi:MAG: UDP-N-acetylmuramoyl-L-alanyl-D-glutamate--2,6-diaminopimelate ligase [Oscillospiraceae bacterium]|nr:UDP-N-acetylmuramoyl-L-alanyl-D-glutamate--2,6-diaminopimelate ligase [Oscillospiraceae bacterium]
MKLGQLLEKIEVIDQNTGVDMEIHGVSFDTRKLEAGSVFVAVSGFESDGHDYIPLAMEKGAACVICEKKPEADVPYVLVEDSRKALAILSSAWFGYPAEKLILVGVTGTNGKTTVTTLLKSVIEQCTGCKAGLMGTSLNMIGEEEIPSNLTTPESYDIQELLQKMVEAGCKYAVMEVSSHALSLSRVHGMEYEVGVFTNLTPEHLDFHGSMENYAEAKAQLFGISKNSAINIDDEYADIMIEKAKGPVLSYAVNNDSANLVGKDVKLYAGKVAFCALTIGHLVRVELHIPGMFSVYNALAVMAAAHLLGLNPEQVTQALSDCSGVKGRAEVVPVDGDFTVLIDYAHTPDALEKIVTTVKGSATGRVVTLFGCGGDRDNKKRPLMGGIAAEYSDFVIVTSDNPRTEDPAEIIKEILAGMKNTKTPYKVIENRREAIHWAVENAQAGDVIILAGKGHETYQILGKEKIHFDEREVVAECLKK